MRTAKWFIVGIAMLVVGLSADVAGGGFNSGATQAAPPAQVPPPGVWAQYCSQAQPGTVQVVILWTPSRQGQQWLDLSVFNNGFLPGTFLGVGPFSEDAWIFVWDGLRPGTTHYIRVNTLTAWGWQTSGTAAVTTGYCGSSGSTFRSGSFEVTINSVTDPYYSGNEFVTPDFGYRYVVYDVTIRNIGYEKTFVASFDFSLKDAANYIYDSDWLIPTQGLLSGIQLRPGEAMRGGVGFEIPANARPVLLVFDPCLFTSECRVDIPL